MNQFIENRQHLWLKGWHYFSLFEEGLQKIERVYNNNRQKKLKKWEHACQTGNKSTLINDIVQMVSIQKIIRVQKDELQLIELMYDDLACRTSDNVLTREIFDTFFHLNGLWSHQMFLAFDQDKDGLVKYEQFVTGIQLLVKGSFEERSRLLYKFYDMSNSGGVSYPELLKMLYSYSKEDLRQMITEQNFLKTIDSYQLLFFFKPEQEVGDINIIEEVQQQKLEDLSPERKHSEYMPSSTELIEMQEKFRKEMEEFKSRKNKIYLNGKNLKPIGLSRGAKKRTNQKKMGSMLTAPTYSHKNLKLTNNVASLVKKYATYIFNQLKLDKLKDQINFQQFLTIIRNHQKIFKIYFEGFHSYIWMLQNNVDPEFMRIQPFIQSNCVEVYKGQKNLRYLKYIKTTIFIFPKKNKRMPLEIKNMEGLIVEAKRNENGFGMTIKHRDGIYPQKQYYFENGEVQGEWLKYLDEFKENSIYNQYQIMQKIGAGNFSSVYRGVQKNTNKEVAVKVIQKQKLSESQKAVIKFEKSILELCHHPHVVRFYCDYSTKTRIYIVTELVKGGDLFQITKRTTFLEEYEAAIIFQQLVEAIKYLNVQLGLIHRDLKPENVLVVPNKEKNAIPRVKLIDFGFAVYKANLGTLPDNEKFAGTPGFVAPQIFMEQDYDESVDMFSLGIIMYFMLCGNLPFNSPIYQQIVEQTKQCNVSLKNAHWSNISDDAKDLLSHILTFKANRINSQQVLDHPWLRNIEELKQYTGRNRK